MSAASARELVLAGALGGGWLRGAEGNPTHPSRGGLTRISASALSMGDTGGCQSASDPVIRTSAAKVMMMADTLVLRFCARIRSSAPGLGGA